MGGNEIFLSDSHTVFASDLTAHKLKMIGERNLLPSDIFPITRGLRLELGEEQIEVFFPGESHSPDNSVIFLKDRRVLFGSCMVRSGNSLGPIKDANLKNWPEAIRKLQGFEALFVVPGHGNKFSPDNLKNTLRLLEL